MRDYLAYLARLDTVIEPEIEVVRHLDRLIARDQRGKRDNAAVPRRETRSLPYVATKGCFVVLLKGRGDPPDIVRRQHMIRSWLGVWARVCRRCGDQAARRHGCGRDLHSNVHSSSLFNVASGHRIVGAQFAFHLSFALMAHLEGGSSVLCSVSENRSLFT